MTQLRMGPVEWGLLLLLSLLWGGSFFFVDVALQEIGPLSVVFGRVGLAALALLVLIRLKGLELPVRGGDWAALFLMGALNNVVPFSLIAWGQTHIDSGLASIFNATTPLFTVLLAHVLTSDERMTGNRAIGVLVGFIGVVVLIGPSALSGFGAGGLAQLAVLAAACSYGFAGIWGKRLKHLPAMVAAFGMLASSTVLMLPLALVLEQPASLFVANKAMASIVALAVFSTAGAYLIYFRILAVAGATNLLLVTFLVPVSALALGIGLLGERPGFNAWAGMALIFAGLAFVDGRVLARKGGPAG